MEEKAIVIQRAYRSIVIKRNLKNKIHIKYILIHSQFIKYENFYFQLSICHNLKKKKYWALLKDIGTQHDYPKIQIPYFVIKQQQFLGDKREFFEDTFFIDFLARTFRLQYHVLSSDQKPKRIIYTKRDIERIRRIQAIYRGILFRQKLRIMRLKKKKKAHIEIIHRELKIYNDHIFDIIGLVDYRRNSMRLKVVNCKYNVAELVIPEKNFNIKHNLGKIQVMMQQYFA